MRSNYVLVFIAFLTGSSDGEAGVPFASAVASGSTGASSTGASTLLEQLSFVLRPPGGILMLLSIVFYSYIISFYSMRHIPTNWPFKLNSIMKIHDSYAFRFCFHDTVLCLTFHPGCCLSLEVETTLLLLLEHLVLEEVALRLSRTIINYHDKLYLEEVNFPVATSFLDSPNINWECHEIFNLLVW